MEEIIEQLQISFDIQSGIRRGYIKTELWGSTTGGSPWSLHLDKNQKLRKITINHEDWIYSIGFTIENLKGLLDSSRREGGTGPLAGRNVSEVNFDIDEEIIGIDVTVVVTTGYYPNHEVISSVCLMTNKKKHGPFGKETDTRFSARWDVGSFEGFFGRAAFYLDGLGCYLTDTVT
ncbi:unnamed protein product [Lactuca virosa]|uniref:Jacalin-type lectin domain-containing protein n=1 Tax=Lactuca virosa TaxID=75947 RepID=A0AAU9NTP7_9ASTR|nr:unnamed protein product [Lactuca virosa]